MLGFDVITSMSSLRMVLIFTYVLVTKNSFCEILRHGILWTCNVLFYEVLCSYYKVFILFDFFVNSFDIEIILL